MSVNINFDEIDEGAEAEELMVAPDGGLDFSPDDLLSARALSIYSPKTLIATLVARSVSVKTIDMTRPERDWSTKMYSAYCNFIGSLGSSRMTERPLGELDYAHMDEVDKYPTAVILASLLTEKTVVTRLVTDATLPAEVAAIKGVVAKTTELGTELRVPGWSGYLLVAQDPIMRGRVLRGGHEFAEWYNVVHKTALRYEPTIPLAQDLAFAATLIYTIKLEKLELRVGDRLATAKSSMIDLIGVLAEPLAKRRMKIKAMIMEAWSNVAYRPAMPSKDIRSFLECLLTRYLSGARATDRDALYMVFGEVREIIQSRWARIRNHPLFTDPTSLSKEAVISLVTGKPMMGRSCTRMGDIRAFVEESRATFRDDVDLMRKSDAYGMGPSVGSATSVPEKISRCLEALMTITGRDRFSGVDAFGTAAKNHWGPTLDRVSEDIMYYDRNIKYRPPLGEPFQERDIENIGAGTGRGRWIFDDTFNAPDTNENGGVSKFNASRKIRAIVQAEYEGGFIKLYYGAGEEALTQFKDVPPTIESVLKAYNRFFLLPGSSPHSPEYYLVFAKSKGDGWSPLPMTDSGTRFESVNLPLPKVEAAHKMYVRNWICYRAAEIVRANVALNVQLAVGAVSHEDQVNMTGTSSPSLVYLGGAVTPSVGNVLEANVVSDDPVEEAFGFLLSGMPDVDDQPLPPPPPPMGPTGQTFVFPPPPPPIEVDIMSVDDTEFAAPPVDIGLLGAGAKEGDGPVLVAIDPSIPNHSEVARKVALQESCDMGATVYSEFPPYTVETDSSIFHVSFDVWKDLADPSHKIATHRRGFRGMHCKKSAVKHNGHEFSFRIWVPPSRECVACMYYKE